MVIMKGSSSGMKRQFFYYDFEGEASVMVSLVRGAEVMSLEQARNREDTGFKTWNRRSVPVTLKISISPNPLCGEKISSKFTNSYRPSLLCASL